jgi:hypothetical protein
MMPKGPPDDAEAESVSEEATMMVTVTMAKKVPFNRHQRDRKR